MGASQNATSENKPRVAPLHHHCRSPRAPPTGDRSVFACAARRTPTKTLGVGSATGWPWTVADTVYVHLSPSGGVLGGGGTRLLDRWDAAGFLAVRGARPAMSAAIPCVEPPLPPRGHTPPMHTTGDRDWSGSVAIWRPVSSSGRDQRKGSLILPSKPTRHPPTAASSHRRPRQATQQT